MLVGQLGDHTSAGSALDESLHDEIRLVNLLDSARILADGSGDGVDTHGTATEFVDDGEQYLVVGFVETEAVDIQCREGILRYLVVDAPGAFHLCEIPHSPQ